MRGENMKEQILAVQRMQEFIDENLTKKITLADLARVSYFSPWHSYRLFKLHTGLSPADYLMFQGEPYAEENYVNAIKNVQAAMEKYDPSVIGYEWDNENPHIQLEPRGYRGYIELKPVKIKK